MLEAKKNVLFEKIFIAYNRILIKRRFQSIKVSGLEWLKKRNPDLPLIIFSNHSSWWDGLVILELLSNFNFENYVMMEEKQLRKMRFFRRLGAFSIIRENPREAFKSIQYSVKILSERKNRMLLIFPQGKILHNDASPMRFFKGLSKIIEESGDCLVCPIALRYEFLGNYKPEIFIAVGEPRNFNTVDKIARKRNTLELEAVLTNCLNHLKSNLVNSEFDSFEQIL